MPLLRQSRGSGSRSAPSPPSPCGLPLLEGAQPAQLSEQINPASLLMFPPTSEQEPDHDS